MRRYRWHAGRMRIDAEELRLTRRSQKSLLSALLLSDFSFFNSSSSGEPGFNHSQKHSDWIWTMLLQGIRKNQAAEKA